MDYVGPTVIPNSPESQHDLNEDTAVTVLMESSTFPSISPNRAPSYPRFETPQPLRADRLGFPPGPLVYDNTCDKVSILEICHDVMSLNSSIGDIVDAMIQENFLRRGINVKEGVNVWQQSDLVKVVWQHGGKRDKPKRRSVFGAVLYDLVTGFVNKILEDEPDSISQGYKHFRRTSARVMTIEQFAEAQNWKRIAAKLFDPPPSEIWNALSQDLVSYIEQGCLPFAPKRQMKLIKGRNRDRLSSLIRSAYNLTMKINSGILSENLSLVTAERSTEFDFGSVEVLQELEVKPDEHFPCLGRRAFVLGNRGFGLVSTLEGGDERIYIKVPITGGKPKY